MVHYTEIRISDDDSHCIIRLIIIIIIIVMILTIIDTLFSHLHHYPLQDRPPHTHHIITVTIIIIRFFEIIMDMTTVSEVIITIKDGGPLAKTL